MPYLLTMGLGEQGMACRPPYCDTTSHTTLLDISGCPCSVGVPRVSTVTEDDGMQVQQSVYLHPMSTRVNRSS